MEKTKLINARKAKGFSSKEIADLLSIEEYSYRRRERGETKISNKEWKKIAEILEVDYQDIFEPDFYSVNIHNENGQVNNTTHTQKIQYYNIPKEMIETQQEYINLLKKEIETITIENQSLKERLTNL